MHFLQNRLLNRYHIALFSNFWYTVDNVSDSNSLTKTRADVSVPRSAPPHEMTDRTDAFPV